MMKKALAALMLVLAVLMIGSLAMADAEAPNITGECSFKVSSSKKKYTSMTDGKYTTKWESNKAKNPNVVITAPAGEKIYGMYLCLATMPSSWEIQVPDGKSWTKYQDGSRDYYHQYVAFPEGLEQFRIACTSGKAFVWGINEIFLLGQGEVPSWVQIWEPTYDGCDVLFFVAHPDDEVLFFGGAIPDAMAKGQSVGVAYLSYSNTTRRSELLNGLWCMGVRNYPVIGTFSDHFDAKLEDAYAYAGGKNKVQNWVTSVLRQMKPQVVVSHSEEGEYGHKQHKMLAESVRAAVTMAADPGAALDSVPTYGTWQVKKLYLHEYTEGHTLIFDWNQPLDYYYGLTATQKAHEAYDMHITQRGADFHLTEDGVSYKSVLYDNKTFGLVMSQVGEDSDTPDFLQNVYMSVGEGVLSRVTTTPRPITTPRPAYMNYGIPELNEAGFLDEGKEEFVVADDTNGMYIYINQTLKVIIERKVDAALPLVWYEAEIWSDVSAGEYFKTLFYDPAKRGKVRVDAAKNAIAHKTVFAMNTDYYTYRISGPRRTGVVIRNGEVLYDDAYPKATNLFPNLDTLAFYPDGRLEVAHSYEHDAKYFIEQGAENVYSFGPYLIRDGELNPDMYDRRNTKYKSPRCAVGMVEPGHYVAIITEGRMKRSSGVTVNGLALMMKAKGCTQALNLDGGQTAVMVFMGKQLNQIGKYDGKTSARETCDIMAIGTSELVGNVTFK